MTPPSAGGGSRGCGLPWAWRRVLWWYCVSIWCISRRKKGGDSPFSGILTDSSANSSVDTGQEAFTDEVVPSDGDLAFSSGGAEEQGSSGPADYVLTGHPELAQQARQWLSRQGLEPDEDGIYPLTAQQIQGLNAAVPGLELPTDDALRLLLED